jgi:chorismate dehydratase
VAKSSIVLSKIPVWFLRIFHLGVKPAVSIAVTSLSESDASGCRILVANFGEYQYNTIMNTKSIPLSVRPDSAKRQALPVSQIDGRIMKETDFRIGAVNYLNSKPLVEGLSELLPGTEIHLDYPSRLADDLTAGHLDVALIPSIEYFRRDDYQIISDACVAAHGAVLSVKLYSRVPWSDVRTLALDEGSRTSATLARILLAERFGISPKLESLPLENRTEDTQADAILLIGDRALLPPKEKFLATWDLGEEWFHWTGLPFVFAMWVAKNRDNLDPGGENGRHEPRSRSAASTATVSNNRGATDVGLDLIETALTKARDHGLADLEAIACREAPLLGLSLPTTYSYLSDNLQYHLGGAERTGLKLFYDLAAGLGLAPEGRRLSFRNRAQHGD